MITTQVLWYVLHLFGVILWAGGFFYLVLAFLPAMNAGGAGQDRSAVVRQAVARFRRVSGIAIAVIVVTGVLNFMKRVSIARDAHLEHLVPQGYMAILGIKLIIVIGLIVHQVTRLLEPRVLDDGRVGLKSKVVAIVASVLFIAAVLLGVTLTTL